MYGIPNMKLPKNVIRRRIEFMEKEGIVFRTGVNAAEKETAKNILDTYDVVILCCGSERPRSLGVNTEGVSGVCYAMDFLRECVEWKQLGKPEGSLSAEGKHVVIVGTGNTASDCTASAIRQGCRSVLQLVRRPEKDYRNENGELPKDYAQEEAEAVFGKDPRNFERTVTELVSDEKGKLTAVRTNQGEELPCDLLIGATGFAGCMPDICEAFGVEQDRTVQTGEGSYRTSREKIFTAGDMHRGQSLVVWAIAEGRAAAKQADEYLMGYTNLL